MILVADSGSSKTDWMALTPNGPIYFNTKGLNPYFVNEQEVFKAISKSKEIEPYAQSVKEIYFYGAGCSSPDKHEVISNGLSAYFSSAFISVDHDLMGSAYATCGNQSGFTCILGTGSNISYFDGVELHDGHQGLGFVLGDEGSGTFFGKKMLLSFLYGKMPNDLATAFNEQYRINKEEIITNVYQKPFPNTYLANFSRFMAANREHPYIQSVLRQGFQEFIDINIKDYKNYENTPCHFVGSIAYYYQDILREVCAENNVQIGKILQKPIEELYKFILQKEGKTSPTA